MAKCPRRVERVTKYMGRQEASEIAIKAELKDNEFYIDASTKVSSEHGKDLLTQLANFEMGHYKKLVELRSSLKESGEYIDFGGTEFSQTSKPVETGTEASVPVNKENVINILRYAINAEQNAYERYRNLSAQTNDPKGKEMFRKLASEEELHRRILSDEFYQISNNGSWVWGR